MLKDLPFHVYFLFGTITITTLIIIMWVLWSSYGTKAMKLTTRIIGVIVLWLLVQAVLAYIGIYSLNMDAMPPKIMIFGILPIGIILLWLFFSKEGKRYLDGISQEKITYVHIMRVPVEMVLFWLYLEELVPGIMTFEGWNYDIVMGLSTPLILYFGYVKHRIGIVGLVLWHSIGIIMLSFIFAIAILSAPFPLQQLSFENPNIALLYFPFIWLPTFIVPVVFLAHLIAMRQLVLFGVASIANKLNA